MSNPNPSSVLDNVSRNIDTQRRKGFQIDTVTANLLKFQNYI